MSARMEHGMEWNGTDARMEHGSANGMEQKKVNQHQKKEAPLTHIQK